MERVSFVEGQIGLAGLRMLGRVDLSQAQPEGLRPHLHAHSYEICFVESGLVEWWAESRIYEVGRGQLFVTRPGEKHGGTDSAFHPARLYWIIVAFPKCGGLPGLTEAETQELERRFSRIEAHCFDAGFSAAPLYEAMLDALSSPSPLSTLTLKSSLHTLLVKALKASEGETSGFKERFSAPIQTAKRFIETHLSDDFSVTELAETAGLSVGWFHTVFLKEAGVSPAEYRTRLRLRQAKERLRLTRDSVTEIAFSLGFPSSQHFAATFRKRTGFTPTAYRNRPPFDTESIAYEQD